MTLQLTSTAFEEGRPIPARYTADGENISPPLKWNDPPEGTQSLALICEDPDAPRARFAHWVVFNIPSIARELGENIVPAEVSPNGIVQGTNDFGNIGYGGPAPPPGKPHRYVFRLIALDRLMDLSPGGTRDQLEDAIKGHILDYAHLTGLYARGQGEDIPTDPTEKKGLQDAGSLHTAPLS